MKLTKNEWLLGAVRQTKQNPVVLVLTAMLLLGMARVQVASAQGVSTTTVQGTVYLANGQAGSGTLHVSWPSFTTANGQAVAADSLTVAIAPDGFVSVKLAPNRGATPAGLYYTATFYMSDGTASTQYWVIPSAAQASLAQVQSQLMPAAQAVQAVSKAYVDQSISELSQSLLTASGGTLTGPLYLSGDPTQALQASDKHYVDIEVSQAVPLAGGNMTGALGTPAVNGVQAPAAGSSQTTLQAAMNAAGANGAMEIPPTYAGTDGFTNPNGVRVTDLRMSGAQQAERSVKEFGARCDGTTDDTNALQAALNYALAHAVALTIPQGTCKTRTLNWHGESIGGVGKQVSALMGFPGQDVLATLSDSPNLLQNTRLHDLTIYVDQSVDVSCSPASGRVAAGSCAMSRLVENNSIFSRGGNGMTGTLGAGPGWAVGNCAIAMPAVTGTGGNGLRVAEIENVVIAATGSDPLAAQYAGIHSTHTCGLYLAQWPRWSEFRNIDIRGVNTGIAMPALPGATPAGLNADTNRWQNVTIQATHGFTAATGSNNVLDSVVELTGNSAAAGEPPTGLVVDLPATQQGWTVRNAVVIPSMNAVEPQLTVNAAGGAVTGVQVGSEHGLGFDPYGTQVPLKFSGSCSAAATASVNADGSIGAISVTQGGTGCSGTTTASVNADGSWDTAAPVNLIGGQSMTFFGGNLLKGNGGYTVWNAAGSTSYGTQMNGGGGTLPGGGSYSALVANARMGTAYQVDQFPGADFGAKLQSCLSAVDAQYGGNCDARNFTGNQSMGSSLTISTGNTTVQLPCATIATSNQIVVTGGTRNVTLRGCALRGGSSGSGSQGGTVFAYSGSGAMVQVGDPTYGVDTQGFHMDDVVVNTTAATSATAQGLVAYRTQEMDLESLYFLGNANQTGMTLDGTQNYTGGTYFDDAFVGFQIAVNAIGHQVANAAITDWMNASTFVRLHINCPTSGGNPIAGTYGINLLQGDGNTFTGGDVEGCATALHLGANAQNNTIIGLRNENSTSQVVADAGSAYNNWMTGGTMFTGKLTDNGTRNSFLDTFHRSFNGMNGDWYGSQQDATVTNHYRLGTGTGNERGLQDRYQTDIGYRWTTGLSDATGGEQFYQILDELNNVYRLSIGQYNSGQGSTNNQTVINSAGTGAVVLNGSNNSGTGGVVIGSGGATSSAVATINNSGNAQFNGTLQVSGPSTFASTTSVRNQANAEVDQVLWAGVTASQKESVTYKDWNGNSQWYAMKDANNNWALNSATGGLDSFKAYQSTNSGDTYVNASNATGVVRVNYETGAGAAFKVYGGSSSSLYASFASANLIQFPGLASGSGENCLQVDNSGYVSNTGSACGTGSGSGGSGTVNAATAGQIAYYTGNGTSVGGLDTVPLTAGGTGSSTAAGGLQNLAGISSTATSQQTMAGPLKANVNGVIAVTVFGAKGDCSGSDSTAACTDNHGTIQAAIDAAYLSGASVYFPTNSSATSQTVYFTSQPINPKGVSMYGPPGASGAGNFYTNALPVAVRGGPGKDVFAVVDAADAGFVSPRPSFAVRDLAILVDDSVDASSSYPYRRPGRTVMDASMSSSSAAVTSATAEFQPGDVGQAVAVSGAGPSGAVLNTTIASWQSWTQVTLAATASTAVTGSKLYISVMGLPTTQNIGNCGFAYDDRNAAYNGLMPFKSEFSNVVVTTISNNGRNSTCGFFFQGNEAPSWVRWVNDYVGATFPFSFVPASNVAPTGSMWTGQNDFNLWDHVWVAGKYSFLSYDGGFDSIRDMQISGALYGPHFLSAYGIETAPSSWSIHIPEFEVASAYCAPGNVGFRISGADQKVERLSLGLCSNYPAIVQWDASSSTARLRLSNMGAFNVTGDLNTFDVPYNGDELSSSSFNVTGRGNTLTTGSISNPLDGIQPARKQMMGGQSNPATQVPELARPALAFARTRDFLSGNAFSPYFNAEDLWVWPKEVGTQLGSAPTLITDAASDTGSAIVNNHASTIPLVESNGTSWVIGNQIPASKMRVYFKVKTDVVSSWWADVQANIAGTNTSIGCNATFNSVPTTYQVVYCDADATGLTGDSFRILLGGYGMPSSNAYVAWIGIRPTPADLPTSSLQLAGGATMTGNHGTGANVQHSDGTGTSGACFFTADGSCTAAPGALQNGTTATTQTAGDNSTNVATTKFVMTAIPSSLPPNGSASGDLSGSYPGPTVSKINGAAVPASKAQLASDASGHIVAAANTLGCLDGYDHLPCTVYVQGNVSESSPTASYATVWTSTYAGTYRITGYIYGTTASSTAYSVSNYVKATQTGQSGGNGYLVASAQNGTTISSGSAYVNVFPLNSGTAVQTESLTASGSNTGGAWSRGIIVERLQ